MILSASITAIGRAGLVPTSLVSRYSETILLMSPVVVFSLLQLPWSLKKLKASAVFMVLIFFGIGLSHAFQLKAINVFMMQKSLE